MTTSLLDLLRPGVGPSSSHTVGPMRAAQYFVDEVRARGGSAVRVQLDFYGSLGSTGPGHGTGFAALCGLAGLTPATIDVPTARRDINERLGRSVVYLAGCGEIPFERERDLRFHTDLGTTGHPNEMTFRVWLGDSVVSSTWLSLGGGFLERVDGAPVDRGQAAAARLPFQTASELATLCEQQQVSIADATRVNELTWHGPAALAEHLGCIREIMTDCIDEGLTPCDANDVLPGGIGVRRRAPGLHARLLDAQRSGEHIESMEWIGLWALAVCEQNAAGRRIVTAPTNGAAGVIPACLRFCEVILGASDSQIADYFITAAAIGSILKETSAISGAQIGCQGEIGSASAMAAAGLAAVMGGSAPQVLNAAEIALEHHLGLTCDPVAGLVQVPCIERNAVGAVTALQAARLAMRGDGTHRVSFDAAIEAMNAIGRDMSVKYKETSMGGLALSVTVC